MNTSNKIHAEPIADDLGIMRVQDPSLLPPRGYKQVCRSCGFDHFNAAYAYCPQCGNSALSHGYYTETNTPAKPNKKALNDLIDDISDNTLKAVSILKVMSGFFAECQGVLYDKDSLYYATHAAIETIEEVNKIVKAYSDKQA